MRIILALILLGVMPLSLCACNPARPGPTVPVDRQVQVGAASSPGVTADTSVPRAVSVLAPSGDARPDPAAVRTNGAMSPRQESSAMPMPGQNNDHSAPLPAAKAASRP
jgi:hypothetical protein